MGTKNLLTSVLSNGLVQNTVMLKLQTNGLLNCRRTVNSELLKKSGQSVFETQVERAFSNQILNALPDSYLERLSLNLESVSLAANEELNKPGECLHYVYFPEDAAISQFQGLADGSTAEIIMVGNEGIVGLNALFSSDPSPFWTQVIMAGTAFRIKVDVLKKEFLGNEYFQSVLLNYANTFITQISQRVSCNIRHTAETRFCTWLLMLQDRSISPHLRLTQEQIAVCLGINRPTLTIFAKSLRDAGVIDYVRGSIEILDRRRLEASACECYESMKDYFQTPVLQ